MVQRAANTTVQRDLFTIRSALTIVQSDSLRSAKINPTGHLHLFYDIEKKIIMSLHLHFAIRSVFFFSKQRFVSSAPLLSKTAIHLLEEQTKSIFIFSVEFLGTSLIMIFLYSSKKKDAFQAPPFVGCVDSIYLALEQ
jgi:hypothetical protein